MPKLVDWVALVDGSGLLDDAPERIIRFFQQNHRTGQDHARIANILMIFAVFFDTLKKIPPKAVWAEIVL